jgi:NADP-dependent 3-hydroxy acid dehydrogenase YdfG
MHNSLDGKAAIVTGASSGIGRAIARNLAELGCSLVLCGRDQDRLDALAAEIGTLAVPAPQDLSNIDEVTTPLDVAKRTFGKLDILVLNAGLFSNAQFADEDIEVSQKMIDVNFTSAVRLTHAALPTLAERGQAEILGIGSIAGVSDMRNEAVYSATKHALNAFLRSLRRQVAADGIRVTSILPGTVATELWGTTDPEEIDTRVAKGEVLRAEDIARIAVFILQQPQHVTVRELVVLPQAQDI